ncbi:MAG: amidohydrolase [Sphingobium sp.]|jgi:predicted TIM-barrel fold metal-dependent hydrolase|nr:amidohydrolase [Sphingobium sp.]MCI1270791.1 amidohydrolase [Sphingobium sp.]MCI1756403.1 amidohydrolase [Sphingobium sp.]MCI2051902.1 amidohydrolase [Sphingobium sp.]
MTEGAQALVRPGDNYRLPDAIAQFAGEINDIDAHEATPASLWVEQFGQGAKFIADAMFASNAKSDGKRNSKGYILGAERYKDDTPITPETVWHSKVEMAPGAWDMDRRLEVMDYTGVKRQVMYPGSMALRSLNVHARADDASFFKTITGDRKALARGAVAAYNDWCVRMSRDQNRLRPVGILFEDTVEDLVRAAKYMIDKGVRGLMLPTGRPPAGLSPAHPDLDPLWDLFQATGTPILSHIGTDDDVLKTRVWRDAPAFEGWKAGEEFAFDPWTLSTMHLGIQNFITAVVQGGVLERFPRLYISCNEFGAHWIGPLAENLDLWVDNQPFPNEKGVTYLKMKPSEYIRRNVRVAPFYFEDIGLYLQRYAVPEVFAYGSDYPHHEGGKDPYGDLTRSILARGFGEKELRAFFVDNARIILPD